MALAYRGKIRSSLVQCLRTGSLPTMAVPETANVLVLPQKGVGFCGEVRSFRLVLKCACWHSKAHQLNIHMCNSEQAAKVSLTYFFFTGPPTNLHNIDSVWTCAVGKQRSAAMPQQR